MWLPRAAAVSAAPPHRRWPEPQRPEPAAGGRLTRAAVAGSMRSTRLPPAAPALRELTCLSERGRPAQPRLRRHITTNRHRRGAGSSTRPDRHGTVWHASAMRSMLSSLWHPIMTGHSAEAVAAQARGPRLAAAGAHPRVGNRRGGLQTRRAAPGTGARRRGSGLRCGARRAGGGRRAGTAGVARSGLGRPCGNKAGARRPARFFFFFFFYGGFSRRGVGDGVS